MICAWWPLLFMSLSSFYATYNYASRKHICTCSLNHLCASQEVLLEFGNWRWQCFTAAGRLCCSQLLSLKCWWSLLEQVSPCNFTSLCLTTSDGYSLPLVLSLLHAGLREPVLVRLDVDHKLSDQLFLSVRADDDSTTSLPNHLDSWIPGTEIPYLLISLTTKSSFLSTLADLSPKTSLLRQIRGSP